MSVTTGGPGPVYTQDGRNGDIHAILRPVQGGMLRFTGFEVLAPNLCFGPARATPEQRAQWLKDYATRLHRIAEEKPIDVGEY
jgi:NAD(P)H dehydrogenase (quinone)